MVTKLSDQEWHDIQTPFIQTLQTRVRRALLKTLAEHIPDHPDEFGLFTTVALRTLLHEAARMTAILVCNHVTGAEGRLELRAVMEGLTLLEQSEMGEVTVAVRKLLVATLPKTVDEAVAAKKDAPEPLAEDLQAALFDALMAEDE